MKGVRLRTHREYESPIGEYRVASMLTVKELCAEARITAREYFEYQSGMASPLNNRPGKEGQVRATAQRLVDALGVSLSDAFPRYFCEIQSANGYTSDQLSIFHSYPVSHENVENYEVISKALRALTPREKDILMQVSDGTTQTALAEKYGISKERIRNIFARAKWKMTRSPLGLEMKEIYASDGI